MWLHVGIDARKGAQRMQDAFLPVFLFLVCAIGLAVGLLATAGLFNPGRPGRVTRMPYESGMDPIHDTRRRFDVRFHLLAIAFLVFDVELLFLYPWAVAMRSEERGVGNGRAINAEARAEGGGRKAESPIVNPQSLIPRSSSPTTRHPPPATRYGIDAAVADGLVESRGLVFAGVMTFLVLLTLGYVYDWRRGVFRWR
jgi:NADH-quinone oxidoreductase subunit A